ncbi:MAG TPA: hypothetical protein VK338_02765 [Candidatus Nitrosocosmicus sp.]|nr:hypothetical protein [Candidatus Nitrosocosmicus sp.]
MIDTRIETETIQSTAEIVKESLRATKYHLLYTAIQRAAYNDHQPSEDDWADILQKKSDGACEFASRYCLYDMFSKHPDKIDKMFLLTGYNYKDDKSDKEWYDHTYFLVKGIDGNWVAQSPANYIKGHPDPFATVISSPNLQDVLAQIKAIHERLTWPPSDFIESIANESYISPEVIPQKNNTYPFFRVMHLNTKDNKNNSEIDENVIPINK